MCGINGVFDFRGVPVKRELVESMSGRLRHRGPDGNGSYICGEIGLGCRRLSIIDLEGGAQPISNEDGSVQVVFNGEIYNFIELREELQELGHVFRTRSDTEVVVHGYEQWGPGCVNRLNGVFAFALWDARKKRLLLARDHLGVKPLYYTVLDRRLLFSSEIKALLADPECPRDLDLRSLAQLFSLRYVPSPQTLFRGINKLPPAHLMMVTRDGVQVTRYWKYRPQAQPNADEPSLIESYQALLQDAVRLQMRSDVPVGLFLSSGVDSSALLAIMSEHSNGPVSTFTIGFEDGGNRNETEEARLLARRFGARHCEMIISPQDYQKYYERYMWDLEEPVGNESAAAFYFVSLITSRSVKVALTGQGADEPWAGYKRYLGVKLSQFYAPLPRLLKDRVIRAIFERLWRGETLRRGVFALSEPDLLTRFVKIHSFFSTDMKEKLFQPWLKEHVSPDEREARAALERLHSDVDHLDALTQMLYIDTRSYLPDNLLMVADKTSMANSLEARVPYLDYRLVEFVESLPSTLRLKGFCSKYLHKKALAKWLPAEVIHRRKRGFSNPVDRWLAGHMRNYVRERLLSQDSGVSRYFNLNYIREILQRHEEGRNNYMRHIEMLLAFELWHEQFMSSSVRAVPSAA